MNELFNRYLQLRNDIKTRLEQVFASNRGETKVFNDPTSPYKPMEFQCLGKPFKFFDHAASKDRIGVGTTKDGMFLMCQTGADLYPFAAIHLNIAQQLSLIEQLDKEL